MIKRIEDLSLEEMNEIEFLTEDEIKQMSFAELCIYQEKMNQIKARYNELVKNN